MEINFSLLKVSRAGTQHYESCYSEEPCILGLEVGINFIGEHHGLARGIGTFNN
jgi:hypothetical protein